MKKTLRDYQLELNPKYIAQPKPAPIKMRMPLALQLSIQVLLHPALKRY